MVTQYFPHLPATTDNINPGNEKPMVILPAYGLRNQAIALVNGFAPHNKSVYLLVDHSPVPVLVRVQHNDDTAFFETLDIARLRNEIEKTVTVVKYTKDKEEIHFDELKPELMRAILVLDLESLPFDYIDNAAEWLKSKPGIAGKDGE
jgi:hypothetical protein